MGRKQVQETRDQSPKTDPTKSSGVGQRMRECRGKKSQLAKNEGGRLERISTTQKKQGGGKKEGKEEKENEPEWSKAPSNKSKNGGKGPQGNWGGKESEKGNGKTLGPEKKKPDKADTEKSKKKRPEIETKK